MRIKENQRMSVLQKYRERERDVYERNNVNIIITKRTAAATITSVEIITETISTYLLNLTTSFTYQILLAIFYAFFVNFWFVFYSCYCWCYFSKWRAFKCIYFFSYMRPLSFNFIRLLIPLLLTHTQMQAYGSSLR